MLELVPALNVETFPWLMKFTREREYGIIIRFWGESVIPVLAKFRDTVSISRIS